jgi:hypothetical protein
MRVVEFFLIGALVVMMLSVGYALGGFACKTETAESENQRVPDRELNLPLIPEVPDR